VLEVDRLDDGVWRWSAEPGLASYLLELPDVLLLIDPHAPPAGSEDAERFWRHLDDDVARLGRTVAVVLTSPAREPDAAAIIARYPGSRRYAAYEPG
jgi:hypothetical protein